MTKTCGNIYDAMFRTSGFVFYRFGTPGKKLELIYPDGKKVPAEAFSAYFSGYAKGNTAQVSFIVADTTYVVYSEHNAFDVNGSGVSVERGGKRISNQRCAVKYVQHELHALQELGLQNAAYRALP